VHEIPSRGGHDTLAFQDAGAAAAMLFIRKRNGSQHNEAMEPADFAAAARIFTTLAAAHEG
jgi:acetylornithine deacetylase/succinyl-diaminopimelate desuccinylase-like protein